MPKNTEEHKLPHDVTEHPDYQTTMKIVNELIQTVMKTNKELTSNDLLDHVKCSRLTVVALTHVAAVFAVDVNMTPEQYLAICGAQFKEAYKRAPRFA